MSQVLGWLPVYWAMEAENERRQRLYRVAAIVLKRRDQGEADRLLTVLTRERGKVTLLAKGVRRTASRKAGHIEPFTHVELLVAKGKSLDLVTQAETIEAHRHLREDLWRSSWAYYVVELADAFVQDDDPHQLLFDLLLETLGRLNGEADPRSSCVSTRCICWRWPVISRSFFGASSAMSCSGRRSTSSAWAAAAVSVRPTAPTTRKPSPCR